jgi:hypothetical protein
MPQITYGASIAGGGVSIQPAPIVRTVNTAIGAQPALPAGTGGGQLTTRTSNTAGVITFASHTFADNDKVDIYWSGGQAYGANVDSHTSTTITISGAAGTILPVLNTTGLVVTKQVAVTLSFAYTLLQFLALLFSFTSTSITSKGQITFKDSGGSVLLNVVLTPGQQAIYDVAGGTANPFSSNVASAVASNGDASNAATLNLVAGEN